MDVKVLGTGCAKCNKLYEAVVSAIETAGAQAHVTKVEKLDEIVTYGVAMTPALVIEGEIKSVGKIPSVDQIAGWLRDAAPKG